MTDEPAHARNDLRGEPLLLFNQREEREQIGADPGAIKGGESLGHVVVAADEAGQHAAIGADGTVARVLLVVRNGLGLGIDLALPFPGELREEIALRLVESFEEFRGAGIGGPRRDKTGRAEFDRLAPARAAGDVRDQRRDVFQRTAVDQPAVGKVHRILAR